MSENLTEIMTYKLDLTDVEVKARRLQQIAEEIKAKRGRGEDTSVLEEGLKKEIDGFGRLIPAKQKDKSATDDVIRSKEKLAQTVALLGGSFGGLIGNLGGVVELLTAGGTASLSLGVALAGLTTGIAYLSRLREEAERAADAQERFNKAVSESQLAKLGEEGQIGAHLARWGAATPANVSAASQLAQDLQRDYGMESGQRAKIAAAVTAGGGFLDAEGAAALGVLDSAGASIDSPAAARHAWWTALGKRNFGALMDTAKAYAQTSGALKIRAEAMTPGARGRSDMTPEAMAFEMLRSQGRVPEGMTLNEYLAWSRPDFESEIARLSDLVAQVAPVEGFEPGGRPMTAAEVRQAAEARYERDRLMAIRSKYGPGSPALSKYAVQLRGLYDEPPVDVTPVPIVPEDYALPSESSPRGRGVPFFEAYPDAVPTSQPVRPEPLAEPSQTIINNNTYIGTLYGRPDAYNPRSGRGTEFGISPRGRNLRALG